MTLLVIAIFINLFLSLLFYNWMLSTKLWILPFYIAPKTFLRKFFRFLSHVSDVHQFLGLRQKNLLCAVFVCLLQFSSLRQMSLSMCLICNIFITNLTSLTSHKSESVLTIVFVFVISDSVDKIFVTSYMVVWKMNH